MSHVGRDESSFLVPQSLLYLKQMTFISRYRAGVALKQEMGTKHERGKNRVKYERFKHFSHLLLKYNFLADDSFQ